ncbi:unnamed protein product [Closterium sp. NIES-65]|nr:unnamed protein product [Closterium sp. NIES-65]
MECLDCSSRPFYVYSALESYRGSAACRIAAASRGAEASDSPPIQPPAQRRRVWSPSSSENVFIPPTFDEPADEDGVEAAAARAADDPEAFMARMSDSNGIAEHTSSLPAIHSAIPGSPFLSLTILMHFQHILSLPAMPASPNLSLTHSFSLPASHPAKPASPNLSLLPILLYHNLPAIPSLSCASLLRLAPHSGFPVPLYLSLPFLLSPALPSRALPRILVFQSLSTSPCHSFSLLRFPLAPCPALWFSSPSLPLPATLSEFPAPGRPSVAPPYHPCTSLSLPATLP